MILSQTARRAAGSINFYLFICVMGCMCSINTHAGLLCAKSNFFVLFCFYFNPKMIWTEKTLLTKMT